jgi:predicted phage tail protein
MPEPKQPLSARIADLLEMIATKIREMTVDRAAVAVTGIAVGVVVLAAVLMAAFWLLVGIFRALGALMGMETAYVVVGVILIIGGAIVWIKRYPQDRDGQQES